MTQSMQQPQLQRTKKLPRQTTFLIESKSSKESLNQIFTHSVSRFFSNLSKPLRGQGTFSAACQAKKPLRFLHHCQKQLSPLPCTKKQWKLCGLAGRALA